MYHKAVIEKEGLRFMKTIKVVVSIIFIVVLSAKLFAGQLSAAPAQEWTQDWHDAQHTGYTPEEPVEPWKLLWTWNGPDANGGSGNHFYDAPQEGRTVTGGSYVYVPAGGKGLFALSKQNGAQAWNVTATSFNATPAYDPASQMVFAGGADGKLYKINPQNGSVVATYNAGNPLNKSVLLVGGFAYMATDNGQLHKVNTSSMSGVWVYSSNAVAGTPPAYSPSRDELIYATNDLYVHAVNNADGKAKWRVKPSPNQPGNYNEFDLSWPVIAEQHGVVFVRMRLKQDALWNGPGPKNMYPNSNAETRSYLQSHPEVKNLFALSLDSGAEAFIPAVGYGGIEEHVTPSDPVLDVDSLPVVRVVGGKEVVYQMFRNGQSNPPDFRWDSHLGEMVLDDQTIPGLVAGDLRFVSFPGNGSIKITDEQVPLSMGGETIFFAHWGASASTRITDRSPSLGLTYSNPIQTQKHPTLIRRQQSCPDFNPSTHWTTCGLTLFNDGRYWDGPGWWTYWNVDSPQNPAYKGGVMPKYTYVSDGLIVTEGNGGELVVFKHSGAAADPAPTNAPTHVAPTKTTVPPTATPTQLVPTIAPTQTIVPPTVIPTSPPSTGTPQVTTLAAASTQVGQYQKFEATFQISKAFPADSIQPYYFYDPSDPQGVNGISIDVHFRGPSGRELVVPAFYYQDYVRTNSGSKEVMTPTNNFAWKVRFAPDEIGGYAYYVTIQDRNGTNRYPATGDLQFQSVQSSSKGFIRVSPRDSRFLEFSNGQSFVPISSGRQWWTGAQRSYEYEQVFADFGKNGINLTRVWDQNDGYALTVEGHFDQYNYPDDFNPQDRGIDINSIPKGTQMNQRGNYDEDKIIEAAERNGVYIQLTSHSDPYWIWSSAVTNNPPSAQDDPQRIAYWKRNFRYRVARWGYSTSILAWEHWNELGHVAVGSDTYRFYQAYSQYQQQVDPYHHLRTTSQGSQSWSPAFWSSSLFDIANYHDYMMISRYPAELTYDAANFVYRYAQCLRTVDGKQCGLGVGDGSSWQGPQKPYIWGELDTGTTQWNQANPQPKATHDARWAGLFSPIGMAPIDWYWQQQSASFIATKYAEAKIASNFFQGIDYAGKNFTYLSTGDVRLTSDTVTASNGNLRVLAMRARNGAEAYAWVQNKGNARWDSTAVPAALSATFTIPGMAAGNYKVEFWDTYTGQVTAGPVVAASNGSVTVSVSGLSKDIAVKIISTSAPAPTSTPTVAPTKPVTPTATAGTPTATPVTGTPSATPPTSTPAASATSTTVASLPSPTPTTGNPDTGNQVTVQVNSSADDSNEDNGKYDPTNKVLWIGSASSATASYTGLRFNNITIPQGAVITSAKLMLYSPSTQWISIGLQINADASDNSAPFSDASLPSKRPLTAAVVKHQSNAPWSANTWYTFDEMRTVVQEVVSRPGWKSGNSISIIMKGTIAAWGRKFMVSQDGNPAFGPKLVITFGGPAGGQAAAVAPTSTPVPTLVAQAQSPSDSTAQQPAPVDAGQPAQQPAPVDAGQPAPDSAAQQPAAPVDAGQPANPVSNPPPSLPAQPTEVPPQPVGAAIMVAASPNAAAAGETVNVSLNLVNVTDLYGLQATCKVDPAALQGVSHVDADGFNAGNSFFVDSGFQADGTWLIAASRLQPYQAISGNTPAFSLSYKVVSGSPTDLTCDVLGVDANGKTLPLQVVNGVFSGQPQPPTAVPPTEAPPAQPTAIVEQPTEVPPEQPTPVVEQPTEIPPEQPTVEVPTAEATELPTEEATVEPPTATPPPSSIGGVITYQNREDNSGIVVEVSANGNVLVKVQTNANGAYRFTDVPPGTYTLVMSAPGHLSLTYTVTVDGSGAAVDLGTGVLRAGDTDGDQTIDLKDAAAVGANFNLEAPPAPASSDLNGDNKVNIADLALIGSNFGEKGPVNAEATAAP
jgi:hypothetical protein